MAAMEAIKQDIGQLQGLIHEWENKWPMTKTLGFGAKGFVQQFDEIRKRLSLSLESVTASMTIAIQRKLVDFNLHVLKNMDEIESKLDSVTKLQVEAAQKIATMDNAIQEKFLAASKNMESMMKHIECTAGSYNDAVLEKVEDGLDEMEMRLGSVVKANERNVVKRIDGLEEGISEQLGVLQETMKELGLALHAEMESIHNKLDRVLELQQEAIQRVAGQSDPAIQQQFKQANERMDVVLHNIQQAAAAGKAESDEVLDSIEEMQDKLASLVKAKDRKLLRRVQELNNELEDHLTVIEKYMHTMGIDMKKGLSAIQDDMAKLATKEDLVDAIAKKGSGINVDGHSEVCVYCFRGAISVFFFFLFSKQIAFTLNYSTCRTI